MKTVVLIVNSSNSTDLEARINLRVNGRKVLSANTSISSDRNGPNYISTIVVEEK
jgi:hypothetical protein